MKKYLFLLPILLISVFLLAFYLEGQTYAAGGRTSPKKATLAAPACSGMYGSFTAVKWPGGKLQVTCPGKNRQRGKCVGGTANISPGENFSFGSCNCLDPKTKCLTIGKLPPNCKLKTKLACATNRESIDSSFRVDCTPPPPPCEISPSPSDILSGVPSGIPSVNPQGSGRESSFVPSPVCLGLGTVGGCLSPTPPPPCTPQVPSGTLPSITLPSVTIPSVAIPPVTIPPVTIPPVAIPAP